MKTARLRRFVRELNVKVGRKPTVVLLVDEAQRKLHAVADRTGADNFVGAFHDAEIDLKVLPVYAGLGHTPDELRRCGVSRLELKRVHLLESVVGKDRQRGCRRRFRGLRRPRRWRVGHLDRPDCRRRAGMAQTPVQHPGDGGERRAGKRLDAGPQRLRPRHERGEKGPRPILRRPPEGDRRGRWKRIDTGLGPHCANGRTPPRGETLPVTDRAHRQRPGC